MEPIRPYDMLLTLDGQGPRYAQITRALRGAIQDEVLAAGTRLPPTRDLARSLGCSRNIVLLAYEQLLLEGYLSTRQGAGTFVSPELPSAKRRPRAVAPAQGPLRLSQRGRTGVTAAAHARAAMGRPPNVTIDFMYGLCEPDPRVIAHVRTAFNTSLRARAFRYGSPAGDLGLRQQIADRIRAARGITRAADDIVVTSGAQQGLDICVRMLLDSGDHIVMEDPGYVSAQAVFTAAGAKVIRVPVDEHGLDPSALPSERVPVRAIYVTPSHQFPTGAVMPAARRHALLAWAKRRGAYVIEDDYDGEFRYQGRPIAALAGMDADGIVIYCGTFAKTLFPSLRLGYLAVPRGSASALAQGKWLCDLSSSPLLQQTLGGLMATGEYDRHIRRMQKRYRLRREVLLDAFKKRFEDAVEIQGSAAGLHVVAWLPRLAPELMPTLIAECARRGVGMYSIAAHAARPLPRAGLLVGYGLTDPDAIRRGIAIVSQAYQAVAGTEPKRRRRGVAR
jgi:GntR family transcriptional regulator/MocR family aminotransferase